MNKPLDSKPHCVLHSHRRAFGKLRPTDVVEVFVNSVGERAAGQAGVRAGTSQPGSLEPATTLTNASLCSLGKQTESSQPWACGVTHPCHQQLLSGFSCSTQRSLQLWARVPTGNCCEELVPCVGETTICTPSKAPRWAAQLDPSSRLAPLPAQPRPTPRAAGWQPAKRASGSGEGLQPEKAQRAWKKGLGQQHWQHLPW